MIKYTQSQLTDGIFQYSFIVTTQIVPVLARYNLGHLALQLGTEGKCIKV